MALPDDTVRAKLSALNETQDSIVSVAQWVMFHRRHAERTAQLWFDKLRESNSSKKLNLIYLANEIMQQAKSRRKEDFLVAFMPVIAEATATAYKGATQEVQNKIRRVVEVWRQRQVLESGIQDATEARIDELDKSRSSRSTGARLGGALFGSSSVPSEFQPLTQAHGALTKAETSAKPLIDKANADFAEQNNPDAPVPSAPVQAGRLSSLMKSLASAEAAVNDSIKARTQLIQGLEKLLETHKGKLAQEETTKADLSQQRSDSEAKRKEVEDIIFRRVSAEDAAAGGDENHASPPTNAAEANGHGSPEMEGFTPPPPEVEQLSPPGSPAGAGTLEVDTYAADPIQEQPVKEERPPTTEPPAVLGSQPSNGQQHAASPTPGSDLLSSLSLPGMRPASAFDGSNGTDPRKRRKMSHKEPDLDEQMFGAGVGFGLDDDVAANLGA